MYSIKEKKTIKEKLYNKKEYTIWGIYTIKEKNNCFSQ